jgi:hypothetical protein
VTSQPHDLHRVSAPAADVGTACRPLESGEQPTRGLLRGERLPHQAMRSDIPTCLQVRDEVVQVADEFPEVRGGVGALLGRDGVDRHEVSVAEGRADRDGSVTLLNDE